MTETKMRMGLLHLLLTTSYFLLTTYCLLLTAYREEDEYGLVDEEALHHRPSPRVHEKLVGVGLGGDVVGDVGRDVVGGVGRGVAHGGGGAVGLLCDRRAEHLLEVAAW